MWQNRMFLGYILCISNVCMGKILHHGHQVTLTIIGNRYVPSSGHDAGFSTFIYLDHKEHSISLHSHRTNFLALLMNEQLCKYFTNTWLFQESLASCNGRKALPGSHSNLQTAEGCQGMGWKVPCLCFLRRRVHAPFLNVAHREIVWSFSPCNFPAVPAPALFFLHGILT